jgi:hypothetical protein
MERTRSRTGERYWHVVLPAVCHGAWVCDGAGSSVRPVVVLPALVLMMMGFTAIMGPLWAIPPEFLRGRSAAAGIATINMIAIVGGFVGPYWMGISIDRTGGFQRGIADDGGSGCRGGGVDDGDSQVWGAASTGHDPCEYSGERTRRGHGSVRSRGASGNPGSEESRSRGTRRCVFPAAKIVGLL